MSSYSSASELEQALKVAGVPHAKEYGERLFAQDITSDDILKALSDDRLRGEPYRFTDGALVILRKTWPAERPPKRLKAAHTEPSSAVFAAALQQIRAWQPTDPIVSIDALSNPATFHLLPMMFSGTMPERFRLEVAAQQPAPLPSFRFMGRKDFQELHRRVERLGNAGGRKRLLLYGAIGWGKSYMLAALVTLLFKRRLDGDVAVPRVVYLPDCAELLSPDSRAAYLRRALLLAFADSPDGSALLHDCDTVEDLARFCNSYEARLIVVADQFNKLEDPADGQPADTLPVAQRKCDARDLLVTLQIPDGHTVVVAASANNRTAQEARKKQVAFEIMQLFEGLDKVEMTQWYKHYDDRLPTMDGFDKERFEDATGRLPLLLSTILLDHSSRGMVFEDAWDARFGPVAAKISNTLLEFSRALFDRNLAKQTEAHRQLLLACVKGTVVHYPGDDLYDHQYLYIDENSLLGRTVCGVARDTATRILVENDRGMLLYDLEFVRTSPNVSVLGFAVEQCCLARILEDGLRLAVVAGAQLRVLHASGRDRVVFFQRDEESMLEQLPGTTRLYVPVAWNYKAVDAVLREVSSDSSQITLIGINPTLQTPEQHKKSVNDFLYQVGKWTERFPSASVDVKFFWLTKDEHASKTPKLQCFPQGSRKTRSVTAYQAPKHDILTAGFSTLASDLGKAVDCALLAIASKKTS
eukprot:TRINITY_DN6078_c0_g1_i1.p1 TRINITY_DN6078_c0_g1~~TRINITY_DN6078_c0_g1_i1.p1  ORF type:complete len:698 (-),score=179.78 TRINITY_DN6078_c0_g1_i1:92-2185(-)